MVEIYMQNNTKNQHFVPRCLLKNFTNSDGLLNIYDSKRKKLRPPTIVDRVLSENYFYDKDNVVENYLAVHIEEPASRVLKVFRGERKANEGLSPKEQFDLLRFIMVQSQRTPSAHSDSLDTLNTVFESLVKNICKLNNFSEDISNSVKLSLKDPKDLLRMQTIESVLFCDLILDLKWHFLVNETNKEFIISDHPVIRYNWYLRNENEIDISGISKRGLQIFVPLSNRVTLCLYDSSVYKVGNKDKHFTEVKDIRDVNLLNELQLRNRDSYVLFTDQKLSKYIIDSCSSIPFNSLYERSTYIQDPQTERNHARSLICQWKKPFIFNRWFTFCKVKSKLNKRPILNIDRNPELVSYHHRNIEKLRKQYKGSL